MNPYSPPALSAAQYAPPPPYAVAPTGSVSDAAIEALRQTRPWVIFMSVITFVVAAFSLLGAIFSFLAAAVGSAAGLGSGGTGGAALAGMVGVVYGGVGILYLLIAGGYIYPGIKLWLFGSAIGRLLASRSSSDLEDALVQQKSYWKFMSIIFIATFALSMIIGVVFVIAIAAGVSKAAGGM
jgi:hypothetical protein